MAIKQNGTAQEHAPKAEFVSASRSLEGAKKLDSQDSLKHLRKQFTIPSVSDLRRKELSANGKLRSIII